MTSKKDSKRQSVPEWLRAELSDMKEPGEEDLQRYDYMKDDFIAAIRNAGRKQTASARSPSVTLADAVFSVAGALIARARNVAREVISFPAGVQPAYAPAMTRGMEHRPAGQGAGGGTHIDRITKPSGKARLQATTFRRAGRTEIEINIIHERTQAEIRPFDVAVSGPRGEIVKNTMHIGETVQPPRFPGPRAGTYVFALSWTGGEDRLVLEFR